MTITLSANTTTKLTTALQTALTAAEGGVVPPTAREFTIQNDSASPAALFVGDAKVLTSAQRAAYSLGSGQSKTYRSSGVQTCPIGFIFLRSTGAAIVNVEIWC